jgi:phospholipid/cholesterol/gamma-HCH transport system ATP-binding protein
MIQINNIHKEFNGRVVLDGISGTFEKGTTSMVIGGSGTGKSVLLKCMIGILTPEKGEVLFDGRNMLTANQEVVKEIRREMGVLFQGGALFDSKTVLENVRFPLDILTNQSLAEKNERAMVCLQRVGLEQAANRMPSEISGGMKKRVGIARAIVMNPKYLFCDEPNSGLDPLTAVKIDLLIQEITEEFGITTLVISHDMNSVMRMGEYIMFLKDGKKIWEGSNKNMLHSDVPALQEFLSTKLF